MVWKVLVVAVLAVLCSAARSKASPPSPITFVATGIDVALTTKVDESALNGMSELLLRKFVPYSLSVGTNRSGDVVFEFKSPAKAYVSVSSEHAMRIRNALRKGDNWCATVAREGVDVRKLIDGWDATGTGMVGGKADATMPVRVEMWIDTSGGGRHCFVGFSGKSGIVNTRFLLARYKLRQVDAAIEALPAAASKLALREAKASAVVDGLR